MERPPRKGPKFGNGMPIAGDGERLSSLDSIEHAPPIVAQLPNSDFGHRASVSPVRRAGPVRDLCWLPHFVRGYASASYRRSAGQLPKRRSDYPVTWPDGLIPGEADGIFASLVVAGSR